MTDSDDDFLDNTYAATGAEEIGARLRAAREAKELTLEQVASETRISRRHLENLEAGNFEELAGRTYAVGFARTYAKTVGLDPEDIVEGVRSQLDHAEVNERYEKSAHGSFEPGDPSRAPGGRLLYFSLFAVVILLVGIFFAARALFSPAAEMPSLVEEQQREEAAVAAQQQAAQAQQASTVAPSQPSGEVVFTAEGETWVRFYEAEGSVLQEGTMREGDTFTVPAGAANPQIITGRPDRLAITIGGQPVRKLSNQVETLQDVPISAGALLARSGGGMATIGFSRGTFIEPEPEATPALSAAPSRTAPAATTQAPAPTTRPQPSPSATPTRTTAPTPTPAPTASATAPEPAATAPPRAEPAEAQEGGAAAEVE